MPQRISSFDHYIERSGNLKLNTLMKRKTRETSNPKRLRRFRTRESTPFTDLQSLWEEMVEIAPWASGRQWRGVEARWR
jgi:hypothetical protein